MGVSKISVVLTKLLVLLQGSRVGPPFFCHVLVSQQLPPETALPRLRNALNQSSPSCDFTRNPHIEIGVAAAAALASQPARNHGLLKADSCCAVGGLLWGEDAERHPRCRSQQSP